MINSFITGFGLLFTVEIFLLMNLGIFIGVIFGAIPGLTVTLGIVLFLPFTFGMLPVNGILMLLGIYAGGTYGGSISAILINTPGTPSAAATILDGYPLAQKGHPRKALMMALTASAIGGLISAIILIFAGPQVARMTMLFGPAEYASLAIFGLSIVASISGTNLTKGIITGLIGVFIATIGIDPFEGTFRFSFGNFNLYGGIDLVPALIGLFAISEIGFKAVSAFSLTNSKIQFELSPSDKLTFSEILMNLKTIIRSALIGTVVGAVPGTGGGIAAFLSYNEAKRASKDPESFGTGSLEGIAAPEAGNNGVTGATLIPLLTLGIPGDAAVAILLGAFMVHGLIPGPSLFTDYGGITYAIMIGFFFINIFMWIQGTYLVKYFAILTLKIPEKILSAVLVFLCFAGAYTLNNTMFNVQLMIAFGFMAFILRKLDYPIIPLLIGLILGSTLELNLRRALVISQGNLSIFVARPISLIFLLLATFSIVYSLIQSKRAGSR